MEKKPLINATGLWATEDKNGNLVLSGNLGGVRVMVFKNTRKEKPSQPDFQMCFGEAQRKDAEPSPERGEESQDSEFPF